LFGAFTAGNHGPTTSGLAELPVYHFDAPLLGYNDHQFTEARMIKRYSDHAANERTFLAWVRTAIAVMAFGFVIERFDLFLQAIASQRPPQLNSPGSTFANAAGLAFIAIGVAMIAISGVRFARIAKGIESENEVPSTGERFDLALAVLLSLLGASLFLYLSRTVVPVI
jgi:putative membrane protein